jgi:hypothetical protein
MDGNTSRLFMAMNLDNGNSNVAFSLGIKLEGGITSDRVLSNFVGTGGQ